MESRFPIHYNEYYIAHKDIQIKDITLQEEEVQNIKWFDVEEIVKRVKNDYEDLTEKIGVWNYLIKYFELIDENKKRKS